MSTVRDSLQLARINRTKTRVNAWWHATHCATCAAKRDAVSPLLAILRSSGLAAEDMPPDPPSASKAH